MKKLIQFIKKKTEKFLERTKGILKEHFDDLLMLLGLVFIVIPTFIISSIAGLYTLGAVLFLLGLFFAIPSRKG
ncbi:hypothetical protein [Marinicrinis sediminis]|uniref:DUF3096 domain-containing protein n=1 Tax=Marinicrinis sediminis TaxID=1652465 RepID=A0ABW5R9Z9_9BACL